MTIWRTYYHLIWATLNRQPLIKAKYEDELYGYIKVEADLLDCMIHAIGGMEDHIHLVVSIPPQLAVAEFVQQIKCSSSSYINHCFQEYGSALKWQRGYGVLSLGGQQLKMAKVYVNRQKKYHAQGKILTALERHFDGGELEL